MGKRLNCLKWATVAVLIIILVLWFDYFSACLYRSQRHILPETNNSLAFIEWVSRVIKGALIRSSLLFDGEFYLLDFSAVILFFELIYVVLLIVAIVTKKQKRILNIIFLCISLTFFFDLFQFLNSTLQLFVPG
jgi:hypothetical protein